MNGISNVHFGARHVKTGADPRDLGKVLDAVKASEDYLEIDINPSYKNNRLEIITPGSPSGFTPLDRIVAGALYDKEEDTAYDVFRKISTFIREKVKGEDLLK